MLRNTWVSLYSISRGISLFPLLAWALVASLPGEETVVEAPEPPRAQDENGMEAPIETTTKTVPSPWARVQREWTATRVPKGPRIDGRLDDEVWGDVPDGGPLVQSDPFEGFEPSERTAFRVVYDDDALYVGFWCYDRDPDKIVATEMARDGRIFADDHVLFVLDTMYDRRNGYEFRVNPNGARGDALISDNVGRNEDWDGIWVAAATVDAEGWKAEVAIPFKTVSFNPHSDRWGFNVFRQIKRRAEKNRWVAARLEINTYNVAEAGTLTGLEGLNQGIGLDISPYVLGRFTYYHEGEDYDATGDIGGDIRYRITPNLTALLSYNTDFAETEVDSRQINLTRFPLFYPEKRDFFLEDAGIFQFGGLESALLPFYSRRIGLNDDGEKVPIVVAGKLTGREGGVNIGVVDALMDDQDDLGMRNTFVARVSRNVFEQSSVGGIVTYGDPNSKSENLLGGADFRYRTTSLFGDQVFLANAFGMATYTGDSANDDSAAFGAELSMPNDLYYAKAEFYQVGEDFNPALGFAPRKGVRAYLGSLSYKPRPESIEFVRQLYFMYSNSHFTDFDNELETAYHSLYPLFVVFESADNVFVNAIAQFDGPDEPFEIHPGVSIPAGEYWWPACRFGFETASKRPIEAEFSYTVGDFYTGDKQSYSAEIDVKPIRYLTFRLGCYLNQVRLPQGDFDTQLGSVRMKIAFTPNMIWHHLLQYDNVSESIGYNSRFVWEFHPGANFYLVLNQNVDRTGSDLKLLESELTAKLGMTFRF